MKLDDDPDAGRPADESPPQDQRADSIPPAAPRDALGWLTSLAIHALVCLLLALTTQRAAPEGATLELVGEAPLAEALDDAFDEAIVLDQAVVDPESTADTVLSTDLSSPMDLAAPEAASDAIELGSDAFPADLALGTAVGANATVAGVGSDGRSEASRAALVAAKGGTAGSEEAVRRGLEWLAEHQNADGTWSLVHTTGPCRGRCSHPAKIPGEDGPLGGSAASATGLALLPFLGAGQTHESGRHRRVVKRGLDALTRLGRREIDRPGRSWMDSGLMYAHGICAIALTEAYGLTKDSRLRGPAQDALDFMAYAQDPRGGGWRYVPQSRGDISVTGWQLMALKSGALAGLDTPPRLATRARRFLASVSADGGSRYGYSAPRRADPDDEEELDEDDVRATDTLSAVGLLCQMYLGWEQGDDRLARGVERLASAAPSERDFYQNYYVAQAIFHHTGGVGPLWRRWNEANREQLIAQQATRGHARGSWWEPHPHNTRGGRLYATSLALMTLEVYYRYLPLYQAAAVETELPD